MSSAVKQKPKVGALVPTKAEGVYYRLKRNGSKTFYARRPDGTRNFEKCDSFEAAKARRAEFIGKTHKGEVIGNPSTTLRQVIDEWRATRTHVKPRTREGEELHIRVHFGPLMRRRVRDINRAVILAWLAGLSRQDGKPGPLSGSTKAHVFATLTIVLDHAVDADIISVNPCRSITGKKKPRQGKGGYRVLTTDELDRLVKGVGQQFWMAFVIRFAALTGLRLGELIELKWSDISFEQNTITVARSRGKDGNVGTPKGGVDATIPMLGSVRSLLAEMKLQAEAVGPDSPVFANQRGEHRHSREVQRAFAWAKKRAKIEGDLRFHDLRHTAASKLANAPGAIMPQVQMYLRHADLSTTLKYIHPDSEQEWAAQAEAAFAGFGS